MPLKKKHPVRKQLIIWGIVAIIIFLMLWVPEMPEQIKTIQTYELH